jgi:hypothetical protein
MKESENTRKSNRKWLIAVVLVVIIGALALAFYQGIFTLPTGLMTGTVAATGSQETVENPTTPATEPPQFTVTGNEIIAKEVTENLPYYESVDLEAGRYTIDFRSDEAVWMFVYSETYFNMWKEGKHTNIVAGTACYPSSKYPNCDNQYKIKSHTQTFDVPRGEDGKYYIIVEGAEKALIKFKITQILKF